MRVLAPSQIAAGLSDRFALLTGGLRGAPARQRTLEASLDWSYDLLDDVQRVALARLSVFAGSFELDAAKEVLARNDIGGDDVLDLVAGLVQQSLVQVAHRQDSARYRLLENDPGLRPPTTVRTGRSRAGAWPPSGVSRRAGAAGARGSHRWAAGALDGAARGRSG
ncbi:MAG: hypothetical protein GEV00_20555 [Actinophytocola sp.]|nr:hypothetical protein [Actinophytocola sp.]